jgi:hypothetical protein
MNDFKLGDKVKLIEKLILDLDTEPNWKTGDIGTIIYISDEISSKLLGDKIITISNDNKEYSGFADCFEKIN